MRTRTCSQRGTCSSLSRQTDELVSGRSPFARALVSTDEREEKRTNVKFDGELSESIFDRHFGIRHFDPWRYSNDTDQKPW
jgi:hypothetical protein